MILAAHTPTGDAEGMPGMRAQLSARTESMLSVRVNAPIAEISVRPGDRFKKGDPLVKFDCAVQVAQVRKARAELTAARRTKEAKQELVRLNSASMLELKLAEAQEDKSEAEVAMAEAETAYCNILAPYPGRVVDVQAKLHASYPEGHEIMSLIADGDLEVEIIIPSGWLAWLKPGHIFSMRIDETSKVYQATVTRIGARVDPVSQAIKIFGQVNNPHQELLPGMSGEAAFHRP